MSVVAGSSLGLDLWLFWIRKYLNDVTTRQLNDYRVLYLQCRLITHSLLVPSAIQEYLEDQIEITLVDRRCYGTLLQSLLGHISWSAFRHHTDRCDLDVIRTLSVLLQHHL